MKIIKINQIILGVVPSNIDKIILIMAVKDHKIFKVNKEL